MPPLGADHLRRLESVPRILAPGRSLHETLSDIASLVCDVLDCRFGMVTVLNEDGDVAAVGVSGLPGQQATVADTERSRALLELLGADTPVRVDDVAAHPTLGGPGEEPDVARLLATRLDGSGRPLGMVVLGDPCDGGAFGEEAEEMLALLEPMVEAAIENALVLEDARLSQQWSEAAAQFMRDLLTGELVEPLPRLASTALELAEAYGIVVLIRIDADHLQVLYAQGESSVGDAFIGAVYPYAGSLSAGVLRAGEALRIPRLGEDTTAAASGVDPALLGPAVLLPLRGSNRVRGVVVLNRAVGAPTFSRLDVRTAQAFADHATVALELSASRGIERRLEQLREEHRAARELHDVVIQRLFATGLSFQMALPGVEGKARERIEAGMLSLEETVQEIRDKILSLREDREPGLTSA